MQFDLINISQAYVARGLDECVRFVAAWEKYHQGIPAKDRATFPYTLYLIHDGKEVACLEENVALAFLTSQLEYIILLSSTLGV